MEIYSKGIHEEIRGRFLAEISARIQGFFLVIPKITPGRFFGYNFWRFLHKMRSNSGRKPRQNTERNLWKYLRRDSQMNLCSNSKRTLIKISEKSF